MPESAFAFEECVPDSQAGLITVYANYEGNPHYLLGTAPIYDLEPEADETARFAFIVPTLDIPIAIPVTVRTGGDYGLNFTVSDITQLTPLASAKLTFWGFPADQIHNAQRFPKERLGEPAGCAGLADTSCTSGEVSNLPSEPFTDNPTTCTGQPLVTDPRSADLPGPRTPLRRKIQLPSDYGCEGETFNPVLEASPTTNETDAPSGLNIELRAPQFEGFAASPSEIRSLDRDDAAGLHDQPRCRRRAERLHRRAGQLQLRRPSGMPGSVQDRHIRDRLSDPERPAHRLPSTSANPSPATSTDFS